MKIYVNERFVIKNSGVSCRTCQCDWAIWNWKSRTGNIGLRKLDMTIHKWFFLHRIIYKSIAWWLRWIAHYCSESAWLSQATGLIPAGYWNSLADCCSFCMPVSEAIIFLFLRPATFHKVWQISLLFTALHGPCNDAGHWLKTMENNKNMVQVLLVVGGWVESPVWPLQVRKMAFQVNSFGAF